MRGPPPKTNRQQLAAGDPRKIGVHKLQERINSEPKCESGFRECPEHLTGMARDAWAFLSDQLAMMQIDKRPDEIMLEGCCVNYARAVQADQQIALEGITVKESTVDQESGEVIVLKVKAHPAVAVSNQAWRQVRSFCSEFGLSPVSRTRLSLEKRPQNEADLMAVLTQPRERRTVTPPVN